MILSFQLNIVEFPGLSIFCVSYFHGEWQSDLPTHNNDLAGWN